MSVEPIRSSRSAPPATAELGDVDVRAGRELWSYGEPDEARHAPLTWTERLWVYNVFALLPVYAALAVAAALLAGGDGWSDDSSTSLWPAVTIAVGTFAALHVWCWFLELTIGGGRRAKAVLSRPLRAGRHVWAYASGDRVRVYRLERDVSHVPHLWPLSLGVRARAAGGREFSADDEAEAAYAYAAEIERTSQPHLPARALADVINQRGHGRARKAP